MNRTLLSVAAVAASFGALADPAVLLAAVSTYTIPAGTTYTLQASDPHIGAETVVNVEAGGVLDMNGRSPSLAGITGAGDVLNGTATLSLAGGPYRFSGIFNGTLKFAQGETPDEEFGLVIGAKATLQDATVWEPETAVHPLKFAKNVGRFRVKAIRFATGPTLTVEDEAGLPIDLFFNVNNSSADKMKVAGSGNLYADGNFSLSSSSDFSGFTGKFGVWRGRDYQSGFTFPSTLKEFVIDRTLEPCSLASTDPVTRFQFDNNQTFQILNTDIFTTKDSGAGTYPMMDVDRPTDFRGRLRIAYLNMVASANCTNLIFRHGYAGLNGSASGGGRVEILDGFEMGSLGFDYANASTKVKTILPGGQRFTGEVHVRSGAHYAKTMYMGAAKIYGHPGSVMTLTDRYGRGCAAGTEVHLDGCTLRMVKAGAAGSYYVFNTDSTNLRVYLGANPVRIYTDLESCNFFQQGFVFHANSPLATEPGLAKDGGVDFYGTATISIESPWSIGGPFRITDGAVVLSDSTANKSATVPITGAGDVELVNARLGTFDGGKIADGSRVVYEGAATLEVRPYGTSASRTVTVGRSDAAKDTALVRRGRGTLVFGDNYLPNKSTHTYDTANVKAYVNGGLTTQANGRIPMPVFTACFPVSQYTMIDFATIDANNLIAPFAGYADDDFTQGADAVVRVKTSLTLSDDATVAGLNVCRADFTIADGKTLTIANGSYPSVLIGNNNSGSCSVSGANGTVDFGAHEGIVMIGQQGYGSQPFIIDSKLTGSQGVTFSSSRCGYKPGVRLTAANTYAGGTWANGVVIYVRNNDALSTGDVHLGNGRVIGGRLEFDQANVTITNRVIGGGFGPAHNYADGDGAASMLRFTADGCCLAGPLELTDKARVRIDKGLTATISGVVSGRRLQLWNDGGTLKLSAANVHTGGTEVVRSTLAVSDPRALGFGDVMIDGGVLRFENEETITVTNRIWGVGTIQLAGAAVSFTGIDNDPNIDDLTLDVAGGARRVNQIREFNAITNTADTVGSLTVTDAGVNVFTGAFDARIALSAEAGAVIDFGCRDMGEMIVGGTGAFRRGAMTLDGDIEPGGSGAVGTLRFDPTPTFGPNARLVTEAGAAGVDRLVVADDVDISTLPLVLKRIGRARQTSGSILETDGALTGEFSSVTKSSHGAWELTYGASAVWLEFGPVGLALFLK